MSRQILIGGAVAIVIVIGALVLWTRGPSSPSSSGTTAQTSPLPPPAPLTNQTPASAPAPTTPVPAAAPASPTPAATDAAPPAPQQAAIPPAAAGPAVTSDDRILGRSDAPITIVEFASLTCPHCADFDANTLPKLKAEWIDTGKARLVFKDFPLDQAAVRAAMLARCAPPEQFYPFIDALFHSQTNWATGGRVEAALSKLAKLSGMSDDQFAACMSDDAGQKRVLDSRLTAEQQYKIESTPTFFINGVQIVGAQPYAEFEKVLNNAASKL